MDLQTSPYLFIYSEKSRVLTPVMDHAGKFHELKPAILDFLSDKNFDHKNTYPLSLNGEQFELSRIPTEKGDTFIFIMPRLAQATFIKAGIDQIIREQQQSLFEFIKLKSFSDSMVKDMYQEICVTLAKLVECDRVSIWVFNEDKSILQCKNAFLTATTEHIAGAELQKAGHPIYFEQIEKARFMAISDVELDYRTKDFIKDVKSLLDVPIVLSSGIGGVICCETFDKKEWSEFDQIWAGMLADMISFLLERSNRMEVEEKMMQLAYFDPQTGLLNHHTFLEQIEKEARKLKPGKKSTIIYFELDQFNHIQDALGYGSGEEVVKITADRLKKAMADKGLVSRIGFGHFAVYIEEDLAEAMINKVSKDLLKPMYVQGQDVYITYSYGISIYPDHGDSVKMCVQHAQVALNSGKRHNLRSVKVQFSNEMASETKENLLAEMNLRKGLDLNEFELYYQPQINSYTGKISGLEGLIRWNHPEKGLIFPNFFIDLAESTGLIVPIGEWVIEQACSQLEKWYLIGEQNLTISVNISPRHFLHSGITRFLHSCLRKYKINPQQLVIEITENVALQDFESVKERITEIRSLGFLVSIDDFGTGFSAFQYLQHFPVQEIKIDRQFIRNIANDNVSMGIAKTIIDLAKILQLNVVSEGVETKEQWQILKELGCPILQGYYFSKPKPISELSDWLSALQK
ncbi:sensor domain-containing phosphodiesterase [Bacillus niameyensis]|uniref:sensor domain-containing phosphodiesterase n=1 Tax=Bacillus niameyensis TaxID=1522308 RepID=UPI0007813B03|nr:sensor domain-containing phosphodiesterase [Bacillus niameyensis]